MSRALCVHDNVLIDASTLPEGFAASEFPLGIVAISLLSGHVASINPNGKWALVALTDDAAIGEHGESLALSVPVTSIAVIEP